MATLGYIVRQIFETVTKPTKVTADPMLFPRICLLSFLEIQELLVIRKQESPKEHRTKCWRLWSLLIILALREWRQED